MPLHADVRVIALGFGRGQQDERGMQAGSSLGLIDQTPTDAVPLCGLIHRQIG